MSNYRKPDFSRDQRMLSAVARSHLNAGLEPAMSLGSPGQDQDESPSPRPMPEVNAEGRLSMAVVAAAVSVLVGESVSDQRLSPAFERFTQASYLTDGFGHTRAVYRPLVGHVFAAAGHSPSTLNMSSADPQARAQELDQVPHQDGGDGQSLAMTLMERMWKRTGPSRSINDRSTALDRALDRVLNTNNPSGPLERFEDHGGTLESWWYGELVGLHALANLASLTRDDRGESLERCVSAVVDYHVEYTEPDNGSAQPWALAAFLARSHSRGFAERQLHNAEIALAQSDGRSGLVSGLLMADAAHTLRCMS